VAVPEVIILGHKCTYEGHVPDDSKTAKIRDWPPCKNICDICAFLSITGYMCVWIENYSTIAHPLHDLTCKNQPFVWTKGCNTAMKMLKDAIINLPALIPINYVTDCTIYLAIDSSI
jgi:hypothetical protein